MKKILLSAVAFVFLAIPFASCNNVPNVPADAEINAAYERDVETYAQSAMTIMPSDFEERIIDENSFLYCADNSIPASTYTWQEAYAEILRYYCANVPMPEWLDEGWNWSFFLHDMTGEGIPTLFIGYIAAGIWCESIYHAANGEVIPIDGSFFAYWGIIPPANRPGIIIQAYGHYTFLELGLGELSVELSMRRPFMDDDEGWYINDVNVSEDEFTEAFRDVVPIWWWDSLYFGDRTNIFPSAITEANIQSMIFGR